jgi:hypothetical protein
MRRRQLTLRKRDPRRDVWMTDGTQNRMVPVAERD